MIANKPNLKYKFVKSKSPKRLFVRAEPSEWGCSITGVVSESYTDGSQTVDISWSVGSFTYNTADARMFFKAGLRLCNKVDAELAKKGCK